ncbi:MAG: hypothetical protein JRJ49_08380 [Deltaproteobacteria bacterium]|nr:hypothetical protein [Deltaproteobacteria bacterium]
MKDIIKTFTSAILIIAAFFLFFEGIYNFRVGKDISDISLAVPLNDISIYNELIPLSESSLNYLDANIEKLYSIKKIGLGKLQIAYAGENEDIKTTITDYIGKYKDITITINGDIFEQTYTIKMLLNSFQNFLLIHSIEGEKKGAVINARIYGKK